MLRSEDAVRDGYTPSDGTQFVKGAKQLLGFDQGEKDVQQGTGQIQTFNQLGFSGINDKPDGWYLPNDVSRPAIILETKAESEDLTKDKWLKELFKNIDIVSKKYNKVVGILYNGSHVDADHPITIDNEHVVAWSDSLNYEIKIASGTFGFTTGEGFNSVYADK